MRKYVCFLFFFVSLYARYIGCNGCPREREVAKENFSVEFSSYFTYPVYSTNTRGMDLSWSIYPDTNRLVVMLNLNPELH